MPGIAGEFNQPNALHFSGLFSPSDLMKVQMKHRPFSTCSLPIPLARVPSSPFFFSSQSPATALALLSSALNFGIGLGPFVPLPQSLPQIFQTVPGQLLLHSRSCLGAMTLIAPCHAQHMVKYISGSEEVLPQT